MGKPGPRAMARRLRDVLVPLYPEGKPLLAYDSPFQLLVAVVLSAQCTDEQVNRVTPDLFRSWPDPAALAEAPLPRIEAAIRSAGFYRVKARYLKGLSRAIRDLHGGEVPESMEALTTLPGVGRKSAHLVRSACFGLPGIIPDTHFIRVLYRTGVIDAKDPVKAERATAAYIESADWTAFSHAVNRHGKWTCSARAPSCPSCPLLRFCPRAGLMPTRSGA